MSTNICACGNETMVSSSYCGRCHNKIIMADFVYRPRRTRQSRPGYSHHGACIRCGNIGRLQARGLDSRCYRLARLSGQLDTYSQKATTAVQPDPLPSRKTGRPRKQQQQKAAEPVRIHAVNNGRKWTTQDDNIIRYSVGHRPIEQIAQLLGRTLIAVETRVRMLGINPRHEAIRSSGIGVTEVTECLGVHCSTVHRWIRSKLLKAQSVRFMQQSYVSIDPDDLVAFLQERGALYRLNPVGEWRDIVDQARVDLQARYIATREIGAICGLDTSAIRRWTARHHFPKPAFCIEHSGGNYYCRTDVIAWLNAHPLYWTAAARRELLSEQRYDRAA